MDYEVTYYCGHSGTVNISDREKNPEKLLNWYKEKGYCPECFKKMKEAEKDANNIKFGLPALVGSDKQAEWADSIRGAAMSYLVTYCDSDDDEIFSLIKKKKDAKWWIEHQKKLKSRDYEAIYKLLGGKG